MPLFEYQCKSCSKEFELLVRGSETPACPSCHGTELAKRFSVFAAHANGSPRETSATREARGTSVPCGACGDPRGPGACSIN
jgi:putative FmdB family regulatory protein